MGCKMATIALYAGKINNMPSLIKDVRKSVEKYNKELAGLYQKTLKVDVGVCDLGEVMDSLRASSQTQEQRIEILENFQENSEDFIQDTIRIDNNVADTVDQNKDDFYDKYDYLKPDCEKSGWEKFCDACKAVGEWCKEHWKLIVTIVIVAVAIVLICTGVGGAIVLGAAWGALMGAGIGGLSGGLESLANGGSFWEGFENGAFSGAISGAIMGGAMAGLGQLGAVLGKGISCASKLGKLVKVTAKVTSVLSKVMGSFDTLAMFDKTFGLFGGNLADFNAKLHESTAYNVFQIGVTALAVFTNGMTSTMSCFVAGTMILTSFGLVAIENIKVGDKVISSDPISHKTNEKTVLETYVNKAKNLIHLQINGEEIVTTESHPFYVQGFGFIQACKLHVGDKLVSVSGETLNVEKSLVEECEEPVNVYNFQVEHYHTYFVGQNGVLVHNKCRTIRNDDGSYDVEAEYKEGWTDEQKAAADQKCKQLSEADTKIASKDQIDTQRQASKSSNQRFREENNIPKSQDVDHIQDLQFGGSDSVGNKQGLDRSVNRSLGSQFKNGTSDLPEGTVLREFRMVDKITP